MAQQQHNVMLTTSFSVPPSRPSTAHTVYKDSTIRERSPSEHRGAPRYGTTLHNVFLTLGLYQTYSCIRTKRTHVFVLQADVAAAGYLACLRDIDVPFVEIVKVKREVETKGQKTSKWGEN